MTRGASTRAPAPGLWCLAAGAALVVHAAPAAAGDKKALEVYEDAVDLAKEGRFEDALELFEQAMDMGAPPVVLYNIARCYESMGKLSLAVDYYERYIATPGAEGVEEIEGTMDELRRKPSRIEISTEPPGAEVQELLSDATKLEIGSTPVDFTADAGKHTYILSKDGFKPKRISLKAGLGKPFVLDITLTPKPEEVVAPQAEPARFPRLGLVVEAGGGIVLHPFRKVGFQAGGDASIGIGWRFSRGSATGFALGIRVSLRPYELSARGESRTYGSLLAAILAVPSVQIRLHQRLGLEVSLPVGFVLLAPFDRIPASTEIELVGGTIQGGPVGLFDAGVAIALRVVVVSGLYLAMEPVHAHVLVPLDRWLSGTKALADVDITARIGFEF